MKWLHQIEDMTDQMHANGIIWGDVQADNVLVDGEDNAWIIDFGGSYTEGWVDEPKMETLEGDMQGFAEMKRRLIISLVERRGMP